MREQDQGTSRGSIWLSLPRSPAPTPGDSWRGVAETDVEALRALLRRADADARRRVWTELQEAQSLLHAGLNAAQHGDEAAEAYFRRAAEQARQASEGVISRFSVGFRGVSEGKVAAAVPSTPGGSAAILLGGLGLALVLAMGSK